MSTPISFTTPNQAEIDRLIAQAHQMRSEYIAQSLKSVFERLRGLFSTKNSTKAATA